MIENITPIPGDGGEQATVNTRESASQGSPARKNRRAKIATRESADKMSPSAQEAKSVAPATALSAAPLGEIPPADVYAPSRANEASQAGRGAKRPTRESASPMSPHGTNTGADAPGQAMTEARESAIPRTPHHDDNAAVFGARESAKDTPQRGEAVQISRASDGQRNLDRFADPIIAEIAEVWRLRQRVVEAQRKLTLQAKAVCRMFCGGDKKAAGDLWTRIEKGEEAGPAAQAIAPYLMAMEPFKKQRKAYEKVLAKLGKQVPIAHVCDEIKGVGHGTLATIVAELGDLSAYEKGIAGIWKRAGLAVIDGGRQRRVADKDAALIHGYSPSRRSVIWNIATSLIKAQGTGDEAGPYRLIYDQRKALELARVPKAHAHNRAMRHMTKALLRDLWRAWRAHNRKGEP